MARRRMNGSATARISIAVSTRVGTPCVLERVLQRQRVDHGRQHAHVVGGRAIHAARAGGQAAEDVAAADHDRGLDAERLDLGDVLRDARRHGRIDAVGLVAHQGFAGQFQKNSVVVRVRRSGVGHERDYI